jgi:hypothetical protein
MVPVEMAFMAIVIPAWATKLMIDTPLPVMYLSRLRIFYRFIWIYSDLFDEGFVSKSLSIDMIRSCHVMCHVTYKPFVQWHVTLGESCHSHTDICDWIDKPRA